MVVQTIVDFTPRLDSYADRCQNRGYVCYTWLSPRESRYTEQGANAAVWSESGHLHQYPCGARCGTKAINMTWHSDSWLISKSLLFRRARIDPGPCRYRDGDGDGVSEINTRVFRSIFACLARCHESCRRTVCKQSSIFTPHTPRHSTLDTRHSRTNIRLPAVLDTIMA